VKNIQRTLLIAEIKTGTLIYGHSINWLLSPLDYIVKEWKTFKIGGISIHYKDIENATEIETAIEAGQFNLPPNLKIHFNLPDSDDFFIERSYEEENFNPFISLCTHAKVYFQDNPKAETSPADYLRAHKEAFETIEEKFQVNLIKHPHLVDTFTIFTPTRLEESFKGHHNDNLVGYEIALLDYFNLYSGAIVDLESTDEINTHKASFGLDSNIHQINCGFVPDKHTTTITLNDQIIYRSSFSLVKRISTTINIASERKIKFGDCTIQQKTSEKGSFNV